ncbi:MAG: hypothetical protein ACI92G_000937 [Candidatus Pelagisphaera sp.]|jgi:hypothetical protein
MKRYLSSFAAAALLCGFNLNAQSVADSNPGYFDFSNFMAFDTEGAKVEVNINGPLLKLATALVRDESPEAANLIEGLKMLRVRVYTVTDENREGFAQSVKEISEKLNTEKWDQLVRVNDGDSNVGIFARMPSDEAISGLVISVAEADEAVFINIVGDIELDSIADLGRHLDIPALDKLRELEKSVEES